MRLGILTIFLALFALCVSAQTYQRIDSLEEVFETTLTNIEKLHASRQLFEELRDSDSLRSLKYGLEAVQAAMNLNKDSLAASILYEVGWSQLSWSNLEMAKTQFDTLLAFSTRRDIPRGIASGNKGLGEVFRVKGDYNQALASYSKAIEYWELIGDKKGLAYSLNNMGVVYRNISDIPKALEFYLNAVSLLEDIADARGIGYISSNIGNIYYEQAEYKKAEVFHRKALRFNSEIEDSKGIAYALNNLGITQLEMGLARDAMDNFKSSLEINRKINVKEGELNALINIGDTYLDLNFPDSSRAFYQEALRLSEEGGDKQSESYALYGLGNVEYNEKNYAVAGAFYKQSLTISEQIRYPSNIINNAEKLSSVYKILGDYQSALAYYSMYKEVSDSIYNEKQTERFVRIQARNEFDQERDSLMFVQEKERILLQTEIARRKGDQRILVIGLILFTVIILVVFVYNRKLHKLNKEITQQRDELDKVNKTKSRFFSIISHDLRGPMSILTGYGELIQHYLGKNYGVDNDPELGKISKYLKESSNQVLDLLDSLLKWALKEESGIQINKELLNFKSCVAETFEIVKHQAMSKKIELVSDVTKDYVLFVDKNSLMTILRNLIGNALKFTPEAGTISVSAMQASGLSIIRVTDTGVGIAQEKMDTLFEIDENKVSSGTKGEKGTGLGLNLVFDFVRLNEGSITVESELGVGTSFVMKFPSSVSF